MRSGLQQILATTDFHSSFDNAVPLMSHLSAVRPNTLIADCGDFFEGTGYYRLGCGALERDMLLALYDVVAPGNHGWPYYLKSELHRITVCANAYDRDGRRLFRPVDVRNIAGRTVAVTAVIGVQAFNAVPYGRRVGQRVADPALALRELKRAYGQVDAWVVLSHSGFEEDLRLAEACPFLDVVFAGHCHSDAYGPVRIGGVQVLKGYEQGAGFAQARPSESGWGAGAARFADASSLSLPSSLEAVRARITAIARDLREPIDKVRAPYRHTVLDRRLLLEDIATTVYSETSSAVLLNETALRAVQLHGTLTRGDVLAVEPFSNQLVRVNCPERTATSLLSDLSALAGPMVVVPSPLPSPLDAFITTDYLAGALRHPSVPTGHSFALSVQQALTGGTR